MIVPASLEVKVYFGFFVCVSDIAHPAITGAVVSRVKSTVSLLLLLALSVAVTLRVYTPSVFAEIVGCAHVVGVKVIIHGQVTFSQRMLAISDFTHPERTSEIAESICVPVLTRISVPAFTEGLVLSILYV